MVHLQNFSEIFNHIYDATVTKGIMSKVDMKVLLDKEGLIVEDLEDAFGLPTQYLMQHPDKLSFVDEVRSNTSSTNDGHVGVRNSCVKHTGVHRSKP
jgi:hypothetical protein